MTLLSLSLTVKGMQFHSVSLLFQLYFYNTIPWINHRIALLIAEKSKSLELQLFFIIIIIKNDVKAVAPHGSLYLSSMDALSTALSYRSDTLTPFLQIVGGNMEEQIQCMGAKDLPLHCILTL